MLRKYNLSDYTVTETGEVINIHNMKALKPRPNSKGQLRVCIGKKMMFIHRLVAEKYIANPMNKPQVNHIDGNKLNNKVDNLEWVTNKENRLHAVKKGLHISGECCSWAKLTSIDVLYIREHNEITSKELSNKFNVSVMTIRDIRQNKTWKHLGNS